MIIYDMSNRDYHKARGLGSSTIKSCGEDPAKYIWQRKVKRDEVPALEIGTAVHCLLLEGEEKYLSEYRLLESSITAKVARAKEEKAAREGGYKGLFIGKADDEKVRAMVDSAMCDPRVEWIINHKDRVSECSIFWEDELGDHYKIRPDAMIEPINLIADVKTIDDIDKFHYSVEDICYHVQQAHYSDGYEAEFGVRPDFIFIVIGKKRQLGAYPVLVCRLPSYVVEAGEDKLEELKERLNTAIKNDSFMEITELKFGKFQFKN